MAGLSLVLFLAVEGAAHLALALAKSQLELERFASVGGMAEERQCEYDSYLGWMNLPDLRLEDLYEPGTTFTTNSQRFRAQHDFTAEVPRRTLPRDLPGRLVPDGLRGR